MKNFFVFIVVLLFACISASAQSIYSNYGEQNVIRLETNFPIFDDNTADLFNFPTFDSYLIGELKTGAKNKVTIEVPLSVSSFADNFFGNGDTETTIGNVAIAFQLHSLKSNNFLEFKLRLPTIGDNNLFQATDFTERLTAGLNEIWSLESSYLLDYKFGNGGYYRFKPGIKFILFTSDFIDNELEFLFDASGLIGYRNDFLDINGGISTTNVISEPDLDFNDRNLSQFFATVTYTKSNFKPGLIIRIPFDEIAFNWTVGFNLVYTFNPRAASDKE